MPTVFETADFFLFRQDEDAGDTISNMKLQKLCYYAQGFSLAMTGNPLFSEDIQAWKQGPVIPALYKTLNKFGTGSLGKPSKAEQDIYAPFSRQQLHVLEEVNEEYGQYTASRLRDFIHEEPPWRNHYKPDEITHNEVIPLSEMKKFFQTQLIDA